MRNRRRRGGKGVSNRGSGISNLGSGFGKPVDKVAEIRADQIREGRKMMAAEKEKATHE